MWTWLFKKNPYHDELGRFSTKDQAAQAGTAESAMRAAYEDAEAAQLIARALPDPARRAEYERQLQAANDAYHGKKGTNYKYSNNGDGTGGYTEARKVVHRLIIDKLFEDWEGKLPKDGDQPTMTVLGGRGGSGKSNFDAKELEANGKDPSLAAYDSRKTVVLDSDKIKELLPDYDPSMAAAVHEESKHILGQAVRMAKRLGVNVVLDVTMRDTALPWVRSFEASGYKVEAAYMVRPAHLAGVQAIERWDRPSTTTDIYGTVRKWPNGRLVPVTKVLQNTDNERHFDRLKKKVSKYKIVDHSGQLGKFKIIEEYPKPVTKSGGLRSFFASRG